MAKIERKKLSKEAIKNSNKNNKWWTKKKIIISSIIAGIAVICAVVGTILYFVLSDDDDDTTYDYFVSALTDDGNEVTFEKTSYRGLQMLASSENDLYKEYIIVFVYDSTQFYPDESDDEDNYSKTDDEILEKMANLQYDVNNAKAKDETLDLSLYIVDSTVGDNSSIFSDSTFYGDNTSEDDTYTVSILLLVDGELVTTFDYEDSTSGKTTSKTIFATDKAIANSTAINNLSLYVQNELK